MSLRSIKANSVDRVCAPELDFFFTHHLRPRIPVIIEDGEAFKHAIQLWSLNFFSKLHGHQIVQVKRLNKRYKIRLSEYLEYVASMSASSRIGNPPFYLANVVVATTFPERTSDFDVPPYFLPNWLERLPLKSRFPIAAKSSAELFIGPPGARLAHLHRDKFATHSWLSQISGMKQVWLISPRQSDCVYPIVSDPDLSDVENPDRVDNSKFPLLANAQVMTSVLGPGETLFIPSGWWHAAESMTTSISLSGNFVNRSNYSDFRKGLMETAGLRGRLPNFVSNSLLTLHHISCTMTDLLSRQER